MRREWENREEGRKKRREGGREKSEWRNE